MRGLKFASPGAYSRSGSQNRHYLESSHASPHLFLRDTFGGIRSGKSFRCRSKLSVGIEQRVGLYMGTRVTRPSNFDGHTFRKKSRLKGPGDHFGVTKA
jgi:hypothetical protein